MKQNALLLCCAVIVGIVLGEAGLRISGVSYPVFDTYDHDRGIALKPGKEGWYDGEGKAYVAINSLGYRDVEHTKVKPAGVFRIAVLGDSFTEARQVDIEETFWKRLEARLDRRREFEGRRIEVLNFGVGGYGTAQQLLTLKLHALDFSPDLVVLAFCPGNDIADNSKLLSSQVNRSFRPFYSLRDGALVLDSSFRDFSLTYLQRRVSLTVIHYSRVLELMNQARRLVAARRSSQPPGSPNEIGLFDEEFLEPKDEIWSQAWRISDAIMAALQREVLAVGARFIVVTLTSPIQVDPNVGKRERFQRTLGVSDLFYTERRLRQAGQAFGFPVITLAEPFQAAATQRRVYFHGFKNTGFGTGHWNEHGHEIAADILANELPRIVAQSRSYNVAHTQ
jgi:hypothetical protein